MAQPATLRPTGQITNIWIQGPNGMIANLIAQFNCWDNHDIQNCVPGQPQRIKVVHAIAGKSLPPPIVSGAVRAVLKSDVNLSCTSS